eukprot:5820716-Prymnesium_polylepis.1
MAASWSIDPEPDHGPLSVQPTVADVDVGLYWDYQNIGLPKGQDAATASNRLRDISLRFGNLVERRVYSDPEE